MASFVFDVNGDEELLNHGNKSHLILAKKKTKYLLEDGNESKNDNDNTKYHVEVGSEDDEDYFGLPPPNVDISKIIDSTLVGNTNTVWKNAEEEYLEHVSERVNATVEKARKTKPAKHKRPVKIDYSGFNPSTGKFDDEELTRPNVEDELTKTDITLGLEKKKALPSLPKKTVRKINRIERSKTKGGNWYHLPATEITEEVKNDLKILQMRSVLDPKHFYKKNDLKVLPKYFQIGTVQHSPLDYYNERGTRKNKKKSLVDELLADADFQKYTKRKYNEVVSRKDKYAHRKAMKKMKQLKKRK